MALDLKARLSQADEEDDYDKDMEDKEGGVVVNALGQCVQVLQVHVERAFSHLYKDHQLRPV